MIIQLLPDGSYIKNPEYTDEGMITSGNYFSPDHKFVGEIGPPKPSENEIQSKPE